MPPVPLASTAAGYGVGQGTTQTLPLPQQSGPVNPQTVPEGQPASLSQSTHRVSKTSAHTVPWANVW